ncbi:hypothetical protein NLI96_g12842 [Meripilus lineatus]|uniref:BRCT domain-containing protein n=1 Tax=Meripilus lineatus TaxID=2056292 RepID=A0AAD5UT21_9APHY|nr:hypothetical protein NLI96_g12842 [Physisporinus lineatus]
MSSRRTNKSHKVPNVKLRPAQPSKPSTSSTSKKTKYTSKKSAVDLARSRTEDSGFDSDQETSYIDHVPRPFKGVILCATGISDKTAVFKQAIELGAQPIADLTDKVTHLIALGPGSPKYRCALETRIPIMHPSWITESYNIWLKGDDVDFEEVREYRSLPTS